MSYAELGLLASKLHGTKRELVNFLTRDQDADAVRGELARTHDLFQCDCCRVWWTVTNLVADHLEGFCRGCELTILGERATMAG